MFVDTSVLLPSSKKKSGIFYKLNVASECNAIQRESGTTQTHFQSAHLSIWREHRPLQ